MLRAPGFLLAGFTKRLCLFMMWSASKVNCAYKEKSQN